MIETDKPIVDMLTLRRDLYLVMSLLLADKEISKITSMDNWTKILHEIEVSRLILWGATVVRGLLDLLKPKNDEFSKRSCGEYWNDFSQGNASRTLLTFRQACNTVIHAKEILPYLPLQQDTAKTAKIVYTDRITVRGVFRNRTTRAQIDMEKFVQIAISLIIFFEENHNVN